MKDLLLLVSIICSINCYSQNPNPELFQTWYLTYVQNNDFAEPINVVEIVPAVTPTLTISSDLSFTGEGACNTYNGLITNVDSASGIFQTTQFIQTLSICSPEIHNTLEISYFNFLQSAIQYMITPQGEGLIMTMYNPLMGTAIFQNFSLKTSDFDSERIAIYPNPTNSDIYLNFKSLNISKIQIVNSIGQNVKTLNNDFESINIADLSSGIYILKINTEFGMINKKIVKE